MRKGGEPVVNRTLLDLTGEVCPVPLERTRQALDGLLPGRELLLELDQPRALANLTQWCFRHGYPYEILDTRRGIYRMVVHKPS